MNRLDGSPYPALPPYVCDTCGASGCKLWRQYNTLLDYQQLACCDCAGESEGKDVSDIDADGKRSGDRCTYRTDQIGWMIPAVPTVENDTYWGYTSVPEDRCEWWRGLPTRGERAEAYR